MAKPRTLYDKIWDDHVVDRAAGRHLPPLHRPPPRPRGDEPAGLRGPAPAGPQGAPPGEDAGGGRPQRADHATATCGIEDPESARSRSRRWRRTPREFGIEYFDELDTPPGHRPRGRPGAGLHPARHDHRLRRQPHLDPRRLRGAGPRHRHLRGRARARHPDADPEEGEEHAGRRSTASCRPGVTAKDIILAIIGEIGTAGGTGHVIEYAGEAIRALSMEGRMTVCNMSIEGGARAGLIAPDEKTFAYLKGRPEGAEGRGLGDGACATGRRLHSDEGARFDTRGAARRRRACRRSSPGAPAPRTWSPITGVVPRPDGHRRREQARARSERALDYMGLQARHADHRHRARPRLHRLLHQRPHRGPARGRQGRGRPQGQRRASTPWSCRAPGIVKEQAEAEGLDKIFKAAGFDWREPGCSMCLAMNPDKLEPGERCASTSNRNFEGRQGCKGRTHLVSPAMAAAAAIAGRFVDMREWRSGVDVAHILSKTVSIWDMRARRPERANAKAHERGRRDSSIRGAVVVRGPDSHSSRSADPNSGAGRSSA